MNRKMRLLGMVTLLFFMAGCSGYRTVGNRESGPNLGDQCQNLQPGDRVKITPRSGSEVKGHVLTVDPETLTLQLANPYVWNDQKEGEGEVEEFPFNDLQEVEMREDNDDINAIILGGVAVVVVGCIAAGMALSNSFDWNSSSKSMGPTLSKNQRMLP